MDNARQSITALAKSTLCPRCQGHDANCQFCRGLGRGWLIGGYFVIWSHDPTPAIVQLKRLRDDLRMVLRFGAFVIGFLGLIYAVYASLIGLAAGQTPFFLFTDDSVGGLFFWLSVLVDLYVFVSLERALDQVVKIPRRIFENSETDKKASAVYENLPVVNVWETLTENAQRVILQAYEKSASHQQPFTAAKLFLSLLNDSSVRLMLARLGISPPGLAEMVERVEKNGLLISSDDLAGFIVEAYHRAYETRQLYLDTPYIFVALIMDPLLGEVMYSFDANAQKVENVLLWQQNDARLSNYWRRFSARSRLRPRNKLDRAMTAIATPTLDYFSSDYTELAQWGYFLPAISRPDITELVLRVLNSGHNAILVGYPGVGKMGILEDVSQRFVANDAPKSLHDKRLVSVSAAKLVSGATPAEAEGRLMQLMTESARSGNIVLVFEEVQGLVGITSGNEGSVDLANVLSNLAKRMNIQMIATSTPAAYRQYIEKTSLGSIFSRVDLPEPTIDQSIQILESRVGSLEYRYKIFFSYDAVEKLVRLTDQYIHDRHLPKKALDLLDELCLFMRESRPASRLISGNDVREFIAKKLQIPITIVSSDESKLLLDLEKYIHQRIVDQNEAVAAVANALRRARAAIRDQRRPVANFLFLGPTGVGKTELAKAIAAVYFGNERNMVRLDMSEYRDEQGLSKLIGKTGERGFLTEAVRRSPFTLLLLDEIEKAHRDVINVFLQVMDDARLTDGTGDTADFRNVIIIATSNAGSVFIQRALAAGRPVEEIQKQLINSELATFFPPELINRFDAAIVFKPLGSHEVEQITKLLLKQLAERLDREQGIILEVTAAAIRDIAAAGFDPQFGARPLRRVIQDRIDAQLARLILEKRIGRRDIVRLMEDFTFEIIPAVQL